MRIINTDVNKGTVTDKLSGRRNKINCGTKCQARYKEELQFTLYAVAKEGFVAMWKHTKLKTCRACDGDTGEQCGYLIGAQDDIIECQVDWKAVSS